MNINSGPYFGATYLTRLKHLALAAANAGHDVTGTVCVRRLYTTRGVNYVVQSGRPSPTYRFKNSTDPVSVEKFVKKTQIRLNDVR